MKTEHGLSDDEPTGRSGKASIAAVQRHRGAAARDDRTLRTAEHCATPRCQCTVYRPVGLLTLTHIAKVQRYSAVTLSRRIL